MKIRARRNKWDNTQREKKKNKTDKMKKLSLIGRDVSDTLFYANKIPCS
jgi:hypothetical protein